MRLRRTGAKKQPRYRVVIADARAPRDGAFVDSIGFYDPLTEPATVRIDQDRARHWLDQGVQPSDTVERLLRNAGIITTPPPVYPERKPKAQPTAATAAPTATAPAAAAAAAPAGTEEAAPAASEESEDEAGSAAE
jgi:small subunit ribosomal protein S16